MKVDLDDRYARQRLLTWWDQDVLASSSVLVVGAGALGNEIAKNLALVGVGRRTVIDLDLVERSNLSRCVLFRPGDEGRSKAELVAERVTELNPDVQANGVHGSVTALGLGEVAAHDLVVAGLDNREARVWVGRACRKLGMTWVDGAIEGLRGVARVFGADGPCYECTLSQVDREILSRRRSCALLDEEEIEQGKVPTTATSSSIVAGVQTQEAIRLLHGGSAGAGIAPGTGWMFVGETVESYPIAYSENEYCPAHDRYGPLEPLTPDASRTLANLADQARERLGHVDAIDLESDLVLGGRCASCDFEREILTYAVTAPREAGRCPGCDQMLAFDLRVSVTPDEPVSVRPLVDLGLPPREVVTVRGNGARVHYLLEAT
jgi:molybdopterin/thiamine biosynthesis adenylyltransferase